MKRSFKNTLFAVLTLLALVVSALGVTQASATSTTYELQVSGAYNYLSGSPAMDIATGLTATSTPAGGVLSGARAVIGTGFQTGDVLSVTNSGGVTGSYNSTSGVLTLIGSADVSVYQTVLSSVQFSTTSTNAGVRTITYAFGEAVPFDGNGHYYKFISSPLITWAAAKDAAAASTYFGLTGYLATITDASSNENAFATNKLDGQGAWLGGSDAAVEGEWRWVTGPEAGTLFCTDTNPGQGGCTDGGQYDNWADTQPDNNWFDGSPEHYLQFQAGENGKWNDLPATGFYSNWIQGYVVEYGGMPGDVPMDISGSVTVDVAVNHTVTFDGNGADSGSMSNQTASSPTALDANGFSLTDYTFTGWNDASDGSGSNSFADGATYSFASDITLYAQWTLNAVAPSATTTAPSGLTSTDVVLNGTVNANGDDTTVTFEIGLDNAYGNSFAATEGTVTGSSNTAVSVALTGLTAGTTYHYRVTATNAGGTTYGDDLAFTAAPSVTNWMHCADESGTCSFSGTKWVRYGDAGTGEYAYGQFTDGVTCGTVAFGYDPIVNTLKTCDVENSDATPPDTSIVTKPISYVTTVNATFAFTGTDNVSSTGNLTFFCNIDNLAYRDCGTAYLWTNLSIGQHTFRVYAVDEAGNSDPTPAVYSWWVQAERIKNGSFNTYVGASKVPQFWTKGGVWSTTDGKATDFKKEGAAALKFVGQTGKTKTITQTMTFSGAAGNYLRFSFWTKGATIPAAGVCKVELMLYNGATLTQTKIINCKPNSYNYVKQQLNFYASSNFTKVVVKMTYSKASGTIWFDLMSLLK